MREPQSRLNPCNKGSLNIDRGAHPALMIERADARSGRSDPQPLTAYATLVRHARCQCVFLSAIASPISMKPDRQCRCCHGVWCALMP